MNEIVPNDVVHCKWLADVLVIYLEFFVDYPEMASSPERISNRAMENALSVEPAVPTAENENEE